MASFVHPGVEFSDDAVETLTYDSLTTGETGVEPVEQSAWASFAGFFGIVYPEAPTSFSEVGQNPGITIDPIRAIPAAGLLTLGLAYASGIIGGKKQ